MFMEKIFNVFLAASKKFTNFKIKNMISFEEASSYEDVIKLLNGLQSNASALEKSKMKKIKKKDLSEMKEHMKILDMKPSDLNKLNIIHVSGTKGKGSTCAFCESILRSKGFKTGFYSSPHMVEVRERIRVEGFPLSKSLFTRHFLFCYKKLIKAFPKNMPAYFRFLTLMAFRVFLEENVDVAIIEVGVGGEFDCTNVIESPLVCGVTTLGLDHQSVLGETIQQIAWNKAGIFKPGIPAITVEQKEDAMQILKERAFQIGSPLFLSSSVSFPQNFHFGIPGPVQKINASLALNLTSLWFSRYNHSKDSFKDLLVTMETPIHNFNNSIKISDLDFKGISNCNWPGRYQTIKNNHVTFYLDGAHTFDSIELCVKWFQKEASIEEEKFGSPTLKILLFNSTGNRNIESLLKPLSKYNFHYVTFCPNIPSTSGIKSDLNNKMISNEDQLEKCQKNKKIWIDLKIKSISKLKTNGYHGNMGKENGGKNLEENNCILFPSIQEFLVWINSKDNKYFKSPNLFPLPSNGRIQVLVTGSLHLVGGVLSLIRPQACYQSVD